MNEELKKVMEVAEVWTREPFDAQTRAEVKALMDAEDKTGYYVDLNSVTREENLLDAKIAVVKASTNRMYVYSMHFDLEKTTYRILHSDIYTYDTRELLESNGPSISERFYGPASMMQEIIEYIVYPERR